MNLMIRAATFGVAAACTIVMGFAIQRGATCTVAAVGELVERRGVRSLVALVEASVWVTAGLLVAGRLGWLGVAPAGYELNGWTVAGAALLGLGAFVNGACVFGAIARFGSGQWAYVATPVGFYLGCLTIDRVFAPAAPRVLESASIVWKAPDAVVWLVLALLAARVVAPLVEHRAALRELVTRRLWSAHAATTVIGITFFVTLILAGAWAYTDALADLARGMPRDLLARALLLLCLLVGALIGGWTAGLFRHTSIRMITLGRCLAGGMLMGWGSLLIPGGNDGLILVGMPLLWPYAWVAFATMCVTIGGALLVTRRRVDAPRVTVS
jgi:Sulphur transport